MSKEEVVKLMRKTIKECYGTQRAFAIKAGISVSYLNDMLQGRRNPQAPVLKVLGLKRVISYEPTGEKCEVCE